MRGNSIKINSRHSGEITVTLPYAQHPVDNPVYVEKLKEIRRHRWDPEQKCPKDPSTGSHIHTDSVNEP